MKTIDNEPKQEIIWGGWLNEFLWICAGVNRKVLRQCPTDYAKYAGTGGTILFTAILAMFSGGYALSFVFHDFTLFPNSDIIVPLLFGIVWGLMIFNLDRFMVNTMYSDGKHTISKDEIKGGLPRIILAIFLGLVISTPLELRIFKDTIDMEIASRQKAEMALMTKEEQANLDEYRDKLELVQQSQPDEFVSIETDNAQLRDLYAQKKQLDAQHSELVSKLRSIQNALNSLKGQENLDKNSRYNNLLSQKKKVNSQIAMVNTQIGEIRTKINILDNRAKETYEECVKKKEEQIKYWLTKIEEQESKINKIEKSNEDVVKHLKGFCAQMQALNEITNPFNAFGMFLARLCITLLFICIEVIPTLFKMMMSSGPYDDLLRAKIHAVKVESEKRISDINDEVNTSVAISTEHNRNRLVAETLANKQLLEKIAAAQAEILEEAIELWRKQELEKVRNNPAEYIQTGVTTVQQPSISQA